ncbi:uncharacterized protein LOC135327732, partial [Dromaius novaehollandiae]|uniref:uncharacterized protein LOC135327732 n=1 Tax=Dromaius novaehollandiae TaxID=8790 RepID=UPI00311DF013
YGLLHTDLQEFRLPATVIFRKKRNSPESSHSRPQGQQESKIEGVKTIGIISTPIIWPVKQRPLNFSKNVVNENQNPGRKNMYSVFLLSESTSAASGETGRGTVEDFTEKMDLDNTVMNQLPSTNIMNDSRSSFHAIYDAAEVFTDHSENAAVPLLQNRSVVAELAWPSANGLDYSESVSAFHFSNSRNITDEHRKETLGTSFSNSGTSNFTHTNDIFEPVSWWSETLFRHHITSDIQEESHHSLPSLSMSPTEDESSFQKSRLEFLEFASQNVYLEVAEGKANRKSFSMLAANSDFQFTKSMYNKEYHSGGITNLTSVETAYANPTIFFQNIKKTYVQIMPDIQRTDDHLVLGYSREVPKFSALLVGTSWTSSKFEHVVTTLPIYQQSLSDIYLKSDSIVISNSNHWPHYLKPSGYIQKISSETLGNGDPGNNFDAFHDSQNEESAFSTLESENASRVGSSWEPNYLDFPTNYVDISPSLRASFWTVSYHLKEVSEVFSGEQSENWWLSFNKLLSSPTERLLSISSPTKVDSISEPTPIISILGHRAEEMNISSHVATSEREIFSLLVSGPSVKISESNDKSISPLQSTMDISTSLNISSNDEFYLEFPLPSLEAPLSQHSVQMQVSHFDMALANSTEKLMTFSSLHMEVGTDVLSDLTHITFLNNRQELESVLPTHSGTEPSCSRDSQTACLINTSVKVLVNSTRTQESLASQSVSENNAVTNTTDNAKSNIQIAADPFLKNNTPVNSDFLTMTLSLEMRHPLHSDSKLRFSVPPNSYSTPPLPQSLQNHLDLLSPSLIPLWNVAELNLLTTVTLRSHLTVLGQDSIENLEDILRYSLQVAEQEVIIGDDEIRNSAVLTSTNKSGLSEENSEWEVDGYFSKHSEGVSSVNLVSTHSLDLQIQSISLSFEDTDYGGFANLSSILESSRTAKMDDALSLSSSYSGVLIQNKETILNHTLLTTGAAIRHSFMLSQMSVSPIMYHQSSVSAHVHSLANFSSETSQNTTPYPPLNQLTSSPTLLFSCLCYSFTDLGCLCRPEVNYSMSSHQVKYRKKPISSLLNIQLVD